MKKIILPMLISIVLSLITSYYVYQWLTGFVLDSAIQNIQVSWWQIIKLFLTWLIYFSALIVLPFLWKEIIVRRKIKAESGWKIIGMIEFACLLFSALVSPPDMISIITIFILFQPIVVANGVVLFRNLRRL